MVSVLEIDSLSKDLSGFCDASSIALEVALSDNFHDSLMFHLIDPDFYEHIEGYYLFEIIPGIGDNGYDRVGLMLYRDIGDRDDHENVLPCIETDDMDRLKIIGVDLI